MAVSKKLFGRATIKVGGIVVANFPGATLDTGGIGRDTQVGSNTVLGFTEKLAQSKLEFDAAFGVGDSIETLDIAGSIVEFQTDTGQNYVIPNAWRTTTPNLAEGGKNKVTIEGEPAEEMT
jgi:hypothetical protein